MARSCRKCALGSGGAGKVLKPTGEPGVDGSDDVGSPQSAAARTDATVCCSGQLGSVADGINKNKISSIRT